MEKNRGVILTVILLFLSILLISIWFSLSYIPLFNISSIQLNGINTIPISVEKIVSPFYGVNKFKISKSELKHHLEELPFISSAEVKFNLPSTMIIELSLFTPEALAFCENSFFIVKNNKLIQCEKSDFKAYEDLPIVEITRSYADYLISFGVDATFLSVLKLISDISVQLGSNHNLITKVKYDNNNTNSFGLMVLEISSLNTILSVRDECDTNQIIEAVKLIEKKSQEDSTYLLTGAFHKYDIYKHALVKRK